ERPCEPPARAPRAPARFRRAGTDVPDAEGLEGAGHLGVVGVVGGPAGSGRAAEVAAAVGVELGEAARVAEHVVEGVERGRRALLRPEAGVEDAAVGLVERDDEGLLRLVRETSGR